ncbi:MAG: TRAP transporter substrate-binding protein DctP [Kofleriaceae bacterium]
MKLLASLVCVVVASSSTVVAENRELRIATLAPSGSPWMAVLDRAASEIEEKTSKRVTLKYFTGGQLGDERDYIRKINLGQIDGAAITAVGLSMIEPSILVLQMPLLFDTQEEVDHVAGKMWPYFQKKFEAKGFRLAERGEIGWIHLMSKSKVQSMADLRKLKMCAVNTDNVGDTIVAKLGIQGVPVSIPEIDPALTSGKIDACMNSPLGAIALQWHTKIRYMASRPLVFAIGATVMSLKTIEKIAPEDRKAIDAIAKASQKKARAVIRRANEDARKTLLRKGVQFVEVSDEMVAELTTFAKSVQTELEGKLFTKEELAMVIKHRDEFRAKHAKPAK